MTSVDGCDEVAKLVAAARAWAEQDCDPVTRAQSLDIAQRGELSELREHFASRLEFGTAGLRALVGPGPARMNQATLRKVSFAVGSYLRARRAGALVVLAYDGRASSLSFARECAGVLQALGVGVAYFAQPTPTPVAAFAVRHLSADAGIVITASHNPKQYNGFKLYAADGCQIVPPVDVEIAHLMAASGAAADIASNLDVAFAPDRAIAPDVLDAYHAMARGLYTGRADNIVVAYTALHGVGGEAATRALHELGVSALHVVTEQQQPDPEFSTVAFPNPEEPGVMDRVVHLAERVGADVALATDPDADRLGVAVRDDQGRMAQLSGNQVGILLAHRALERYTGKRRALVVQSIVSSPMLARVAAAYGARYERTLTGFKWICRPALALAEYQYLLGYEEALGYSVSASVLDKDGVSAAVTFVDLVATCERSGKRVVDRLFELYQRFGLWVSVQHTVTLPGIDGARIMEVAIDDLRRSPPTTIGAERVNAVEDYLKQAERRQPWLGATNLVELELANGRVLVRPSGTEPKLKIYVDYCGQAPQSFSQYLESERALIADCRELALKLVGLMKL